MGGMYYEYVFCGVEGRGAWATLRPIKASS
jgi:hypothetical protein